MSTAYVSNIPFELTEEEFRAPFEAFGTVTSSRIVSSMFKGKRFSNGFGFIDFEKPETVQTVIDASQNTPIELKGRTLKVFLARPRVVVNDNIFLANIDQSVDEEVVKKHFAKYHPLEVKIVCKYESEQKKGFGFVKVASQEDRDAAVNDLNKSTLGEKEIVVMIARRPFVLGKAAGKPRRRFRRYRRSPRAPTAESAPQ